ncbi:MAG TPA: FHA domain-containing protein [Gemmataceae bacterium]
MIPSTVALTVTEGTLSGKEYLFDSLSRCMIGRASDCDIQLPNDYFHGDISRHHCLLEIAPPAVRVHDLDSRNGTFVNGVRIGRPSDTQVEGSDDPNAPLGQDLKDGDEVQLGNLRFRVRVDEPSGVPVPLLFV